MTAIPDDVKEAIQNPKNRIGRYVKVKKLGEGGMATVYKAWDKTLNRYVALKFLKVERKEDLKRLVKEAQIAAKFDHPNIASIYEIGIAFDPEENRKIHYISMSYLEGQTIEKLKLPQKVMLKLMRDVALAIHHAHQKRVVHRDIKPSNIMVVKKDGEWHAIVMDFGLAKSIRDKATLTFTRTGDIMGTPVYMSPEQAKGERKKIDATSDVYSLGATLYQLLSGRLPFIAESAYEILMKVVNEDPIPLKKFTKVHPDLDAICCKAMEKDKKMRYQSAKEFADDIQRFLEDKPVLARKAATIRLVIRKARRYPLFVAGGLLLVLIVGGLILLMSLPEQKPPEPEEKLSPIDKKLQEARAATTPEEAIKIYSEILRTNPGCTEAKEEIKGEINKILRRARLLRKEDKLKEALEDYNFVLKYDPTNNYALKKKVEIEEILWKKEKQNILKNAKAGLKFVKTEKDLKKMLEDLKKIVSKEPDFALPYFLSARASYLKYFFHLDKKELDTAKDFLQRGYTHDPTADYYYIFSTDIDLIEYRRLLIKGAIRVALMEGVPADWIKDMSPEAGECAGRLVKILERFEGIIPGTVAAEDPYRLYASGLYYYFVGDDEEAKRRLEEVLGQDRSLVEAGFALAEIYLFKYRNYEKGIAYIENYLLARKNDNIVKALLGFIYLINGQKDLCLKVFKQLPRDAICLYGQGLAEGSIDKLKQAIKLNKNFAEAYCGLGKIYLQKNKIKEAISILGRAIKIDPRFAEPFLYRGWAYTEAGRYDEALKDLKQALKLKIQNPNIYKIRAKVYLKKGDAELAIKDIDAFTQLGFGDEESYLIRGMAHAQKKEWIEAVNDFDKVLELNPENIKALLERAKAKIERWRYREAIDDLSKIIKLDPENVEAYLYRGIAHSKWGNESKALKDFNKAVRIKPGYEVYFQRGKIYLLMGEPELAIKDFERVIRERPDFPDAYLCRGKTKKLKRDYKGAIEDFVKAIKLNPDYVEAYFERAGTYVLIKEFDKAIDDYTKAISINPKHSLVDTIRQKRAEVYEKVGRIDDAIEDIKRVLAKMTSKELFERIADLYVKKQEFQSALTYYNKAIEEGGRIFRFIIEGEEWFAEALKKSRYLGLYPLHIKRANVYRHLGKFKEALNDYKEAIKMAKEFPDEEGFKLYAAYFGRGQVYIDLKEYEKAIEDLKEAIGENPEKLEAYMLCAQAYYLKGEPENAIDMCNQAVRCDPENPEVYLGRARMRLKIDKELSHQTIRKVAEDITQAIKIDPKNSRAYQARAKLWKRVAEKHTKVVRGKTVYTREGKKWVEKALKDYDKLIKLLPSDFDARYNKAIIYKKLGKLSDAIRVCKKFLKNKQYSDYQKGYAFYTLGILYQEKRILKKALESLQKAIKLGFEKGEVYFEMARIYEKKRKYKEAEKNYKKALQLFKYDSEEYKMAKQALERVEQKIKK